MSDEKSPYELEFKASQKFVRGERIPLRWMIALGLRSIPQLFELLVRYIPGPIGFKVRGWYYKPLLKHMGKNVLIDVGVMLNGTKNISIGDYCWIGPYCMIDANLGEVTFGNRNELRAFVVIGARDPLICEDYVGLASAAKVYTGSQHPMDGKRICGSMIPEEHKGFRHQPMTLRKDSFVGVNSVLLPGTELGEGAVVGANTIVSRPIEPWDIVVGSEARVVGTREKVSVPDL